MIKVSSPSEFSQGHFIAYFSGKKNFDDAIQMANEWSGRVGTTLVNYYEQPAFGKSILVSYIKEKEDEHQ